VGDFSLQMLVILKNAPWVGSGTHGKKDGKGGGKEEPKFRGGGECIHRDPQEAQGTGSSRMKLEVGDRKSKRGNRLKRGVHRRELCTMHSEHNHSSDVKGQCMTQKNWGWA